MPSVVQAGSLADIINLADNPPLRLPDPRDASNVQEPLVLYIARVPGSRDVFLTTMKPQQKVVTAQDVQSSLYYLHLDSTDDYKLLSSEESSDDQQDDKNSKTQTTQDHRTIVRRKPVSQSPKLASSDLSGIASLTPTPLHASNQGPHGKAKVTRKSIDDGVRSGYRSFGTRPASPPRKLLGPRAMNQRLHSALQNVPGRQNIHIRRWSEQAEATPPRLPPRIRPIRKKIEHASSGDDGFLVPEQRLPTRNESAVEHCWEWERSWEQRRASEARAEMARISSEYQESLEQGTISGDTSLSLIRRYNGEQWNVGKIVSRGTRHRVAGTTGAAMSIKITTQGYSKFSHPEELDTRTSLSSSINDNTFAIGENDTFQRHFQFLGGTQRPSLIHSPSFDGSRSFSEQGPSSLEHRQPSSDSSRESTIYSLGHKTSSPRGYILESPWSSLCEFTTGIAGRSIKCKHSYPSTSPAFGSGMSSAPVSELRFNLPSSKVLGRPGAKSHDPGTPREKQRSSRFLRPYQQRPPSSFGTHESQDRGYYRAKVDIENRLDLSLGQEHAGGGFGGKHAKLGKLIVEMEGLQMLDFVVAANMALWWKNYERIT